MSNLLLHLADRVLNRPLLITPDKAQVVLQVLAGRIGVNAPDASRFEGDNIERDGDGNVVWTTNRYGERIPKLKPYNVSGGVAILTVTGSLVNRGAWIGANSGLTSYEGVQFQLKAMQADPAVHAIILDLHSPGGEAVGAFETAATVRQLAAVKRTVAVVNGMAASAAYAVASGAGEIVTTETGVSGSIGVVLLHADFSRYLANEGITPTLIFAGAHKVDGNPFEPLSDAVRSDLQAEINAFYGQFLKTVALGRGARLTAEMARATEARTMIGDGAVAAGLADRIGTFESVLAELQQSATRSQTGRSTSMKGKSMETTPGSPAADAGISQADHQAAVAAAEKRAGDTAQQRFAAVLSADGIRGDAARMTAALDLATKAPTMAAAEVAAYVAANVAASPAPVTTTAATVLAKMDKAAEGVTSTVSAEGTAGEQGKVAATTPDGWKAEWEGSDKLKAEYPTADSYVATRKRAARIAA